MLMKVDKRNGNVLYNDEFHKYWINGTDFSCISVTTLIHEFCQPFDEDFWSSYKSLEKIMGKEFKSVKKELLDTKVITDEILALVDKNEFDLERASILKEWEKKRTESCERGTKIHAEHEYGHYGKNTPEIKMLGLGGKFYCEKDYYELDKDQAVYPEYLISYVDGDFRLAGQIDLVIKDGNDIYVCDYKTNKKIDEKSYFNPKSRGHVSMLYPLNNLMDCNLVHYQMQLSIYAWMIQQVKPELNIKLLRIIHYDHDGNEATYDLEYLKDDVERLITYYKKLCALKSNQNKRKPIIF